VDSFILADMSDKGALSLLPTLPGPTIGRTLVEIEGIFCFHLTAKQAIILQEMHAVRLAVNHEEDQSFNIFNCGAQ
jgi:hypothetical protein